MGSELIKASLVLFPHFLNLFQLCTEIILGSSQHVDEVLLEFSDDVDLIVLVLSDVLDDFANDLLHVVEEGL